jgi:hypothetical protein
MKIKDENEADVMLARALIEEAVRTRKSLREASPYGRLEYEILFYADKALRSPVDQHMSVWNARVLIGDFCDAISAIVTALNKPHEQELLMRLNRLYRELQQIHG